MNSIYQPGQMVRCAKMCFNYDVGETFQIAEVQQKDNDTYLMHQNGRIIAAWDAHIAGEKSMRTLGLYQPYAGLIAHGAKTLETRWIRQGTKPRFSLGQYLIYSTKKFYSPSETSSIAGHQYDRIIDYKNEAQALHQYHFTLCGSALCVADLTKIVYMIPNDRIMERESFVRYTGPVNRVIKDKETGIIMYRKYVLIGLVFENIRRIQPFLIKGKQGIGFLSETDQNQIRFL
jgi:hypothetical protein